MAKTGQPCEVINMLDKIFNLFKKKTDDPVKPFVIASPVQGVGRIEQSSQTWVFINHWAGAELEEIRKKNDNLLASDQQTTIYRAEIRLLKKILSMPQNEEMKRQTGGSGLLKIHRAGNPPQY